MMLSSFMMALRQFSPPIVYTVEVFTSSGTFNVPAGVSSAEVLIVAGGGGGGSRQGGGGGGGGVKYLPACALTPSSSVSVIVGAGGGGGTSGGSGSSGGNSSFGLYGSTGGGGGGGRTTGNQGLPGGSGGGSAGTVGLDGGPGSIGQGLHGGSVSDTFTTGANVAGGGGGATDAGEDGSGLDATGIGGDGGPGLYIDSFSDYGDSGVFGGGGGGAVWSGAPGATPGVGGIGGGGDASPVGTPVKGEDGSNGTGGGGGGSGDSSVPGGGGGDGIVIVRYPSPNVSFSDLAYIDADGAATVDDSGALVSGKNSDTPYRSASIIKLLTSIIARQWILDGDLSTSVTVTVDDEYAPTTAQLDAGDQLTYEDVFYGLWLPSGNDAAQLLARLVGEMLIIDDGGTVTDAATSRSRFITEMEAYATSQGWSGMVISTAHGAETGTYVTPRQACEMIRQCYSDAFVRTVAGSESHVMTITGANARTYTVTHTASDYWTDFPELEMAKTGSLPSVDAYNFCMAWTGQDSTVRYSVVMVSDTAYGRYHEMRRLIDGETARFM